MQINRYFRTLRAAVAVFALSAAASLTAQRVTGSWEVIPQLGDSYQYVVDTPERTFALSSGMLVSYGNDGETYFYTAQNKLSDSGADAIYYNNIGKYLAVTYTNGNIDLIYDDGKVVNMPDIKDAVLASGKGINHLAFGKDRMVAATDFGIVVFDDKRHNVVESGLYSKKIDYAMILGDELFVVTGNQIYVSPLATRHIRFDSFTLIREAWYRGIAPLSETLYAATGYDGQLFVCTYDPVAKTISAPNKGTYSNATLSPSADGAVLASPTHVVTVNSAGDVEAKALAAPLSGASNFSTNGFKSVWSAGAAGLGHYDISGDNITVLSEPFRPEALTVSIASKMEWSKDGSRLYMLEVKPSLMFSYPWPTDNYINAPTLLDCVTDTGISDCSPTDASSAMPSFEAWQTSGKTDKIVGAVVNMSVSPSDPGTVALAVQTTGIFIVKDGKFVRNFYGSDIPVFSYTGSWMRIMDVKFDPAGNLYTALAWPSGSVCHAVLPAKAIAKGWDNVQPADWKAVAVPSSYDPFYDTNTLITSDGRYVVMTACYRGICTIDTKGTPDNPASNETYYNSALKDQEGAAVSTPYCIVEDKDGRIWIGTAAGPLYVNNAAALMADATFQRPLVPRNDGTNYGDYLMASERVYCIAVDHSNRKWMGTESNGLFLVSADGTTILEHLTTDNSALLSNKVYSVAVDPNSSRVYVGTENGVMIYNSLSSPAADDYSEVVAYPNPVRPEYTGWITISGLMQDSMVKICDAAGNVVYQGTANGGTLVWDGCNRNGERVRTGIYYVMASTNPSDSGAGCVTKIMVVN